MNIDEAFAQALGERPLWRVADLQAMTQRGEAMLWTGPASALFCRFDEYPTGERTIDVGPACGNLAEILANVPAMEDWARAKGCTQAFVHAGRTGWARALAPQGYEVFSTVLRKLL